MISRNRFIVYLGFFSLFTYILIVDSSAVYGKSSLTFVIDNTGSMYQDIHQAKASSRSILDVAIRTESSQIDNLVLVTFNDPGTELVIDTKEPAEFEKALEKISVYGGGDCPELSMEGIEKALRKSLPGSFLYVFSDASAKDYQRAEVVRSLAQKKQSRVTFLLSGDCGPSQYLDYQVYHQIAAVSSGQVFRVSKDEVSKVLASVPYLITGKSSVLTSKYLSKGCHVMKFNIDNRINDLTLAASGYDIKMDNITGPDGDIKPELVVDTNEIKIARLPAPKSGLYSAKICSETGASFVITAKTEFSFQHGFSEFPPKNINDTARQPIEKTKSYLAIYLTDSRKTVTIKTVEILDLEENILYEMPIERVKEDFYVTNKFFPPKNIFKIAIKGFDNEEGLSIKRISKTAIETQKPYTEPIVRISEGGSMTVEHKANIMLTCTVLGFPAPNITWTDKAGNILEGNLKKEEEYKFVYKVKVDEVSDNEAYTCTATNKNGEDVNTIQVNILHSIVVVEAPTDLTIENGNDGQFKCRAKAKPSATITWIFKEKPIYSNEKYNIAENSILTIKNISTEDEGKYDCVIENKFEKKILSAKLAKLM